MIFVLKSSSWTGLVFIGQVHASCHAPLNVCPLHLLAKNQMGSSNLSALVARLSCSQFSRVTLLVKQQILRPVQLWIVLARISDVLDRTFILSRCVKQFYQKLGCYHTVPSRFYILLINSLSTVYWLFKKFNMKISITLRKVPPLNCPWKRNIKLLTFYKKKNVFLSCFTLDSNDLTFEPYLI